MDDTLLVDMLQRRDDRQHHAKGFFRLNGLMLPEVFLQSDTVEVFHDNIGGAARFKVISDQHNALFIRETREASRLLQKALFSLFKNISLLIGGGGDLVIEGIIATGITDGIILLDGDPDIEVEVASDIGDTKASLAQRIADDVLVAQNGAGNQMMGDCLGRSRRAAVRTEAAARDLIHTVITIHNAFPSAP